VELFVLPALNSGIDQLGIVGTVAPGIFAQPGRCWRMVYVNAAGHASHCEEPVEWRGRYRYVTGWKPVWSCERHAGDLVGVRQVPDAAQ
jgi:hypothetical protein